MGCLCELWTMAHYAHTILKYDREAQNAKKWLLPDKRRFEEKFACVTEQINMNNIMEYLNGIHLCASPNGQKQFWTSTVVKCKFSTQKCNPYPRHPHSRHKNRDSMYHGSKVKPKIGFGGCRCRPSWIPKSHECQAGVIITHTWLLNYMVQWLQ